MCHGSIIMTALMTNNKAFAHRLLLKSKEVHQPTYTQQHSTEDININDDSSLTEISSLPKSNAFFDVATKLIYHFISYSKEKLHDIKDFFIKIFSKPKAGVSTITQPIAAISAAKKPATDTSKEYCCEEACKKDGSRQGLKGTQWNGENCWCDVNLFGQMQLLSNGDGRPYFRTCTLHNMHRPRSQQEHCCEESCKKDWSQHGIRGSKMNGENCWCDVNVLRWQQLLANGEGRQYFPSCVAFGSEESGEIKILQHNDPRPPKRNGQECYCGDQAMCDILSSPALFIINSGWKIDCKLPFEIGGKKGLDEVIGKTKHQLPTRH